MSDLDPSVQSEPTEPTQPQQQQIPLAVPQATQPEPSASDNQSPPWLGERLSQAKQAERRAVLKAAGVESLAELQAKAKRLEELESSQLSEKEKLEKMIQQLTPQAEEGARFKQLFGELVNQQFESLSEQARAAIDAVSNGDPIERYKLMRVVSLAGTAQQAPASPTPQPANTTPAGAPPEPAAAKSVTEKWSERSRTPEGALGFMFNASEIAKHLPEE